jgi:hypothetical protein
MIPRSHALRGNAYISQSSKNLLYFKSIVHRIIFKNIIDMSANNTLVFFQKYHITVFESAKWYPHSLKYLALIRRRYKKLNLI